MKLLKYLIIAILIVSSTTQAMDDCSNTLIYDDPCGILSYETIRQEAEFINTQKHHNCIRSEIYKLLGEGTFDAWNGSVSPFQQLASVICHADYKGSFFNNDKYQYWRDIRLLRELIQLKKAALSLNEAAVIDEFAQYEKAEAVYVMLQYGLVHPHYDIQVAERSIGGGKKTVELNSLAIANPSCQAPRELNLTPCEIVYEKQQQMALIAPQRYDPLWAILGNAITNDDIKKTTDKRLYLIKILTLCGALPFAPLEKQQYAQPEIKKLLGEGANEEDWSIMDILHRVPCSRDQASAFFLPYIEDIIGQSLSARRSLIEQGWNGKLPVPEQFLDEVFEKEFLDHVKKRIGD